jgi:hypothetical protein
MSDEQVKPAPLRSHQGEVQMSDEQVKPATVITRGELYRLVWATPMSRLAPTYGLSGNGLKKICNRLNVPYPPPGYWAKLGAGKKVKQDPLPEAPPGTAAQVTINPTSPRRLLRRLTRRLPNNCAPKPTKRRRSVIRRAVRVVGLYGY